MILLFLGLACLAVCVSALIRVAMGRRLRTIERLTNIGEYGFSGEAAAAGVPLPYEASRNSISDLVGRIGGAFAQRFGGVREADLRAELMAAGIYTMTPRTLLGYRVLAAILFPALILLMGSGSVISLVLAVAMAGAAWMMPMVLVRRRARTRLEEIDRRLPDMIDILVVTVEAGLGFTSALRVASEQFSGPLSDELRLTLQEQTMGLAVNDALGNLLRRADTPAMRSFVRSMVQGERLGVSTGQIMRVLADEMRKRRRKSAEEQAQKAPIKMLFPLVFLIFPALFIVLLVPAVIQLIAAFGSG